MKVKSRKELETRAASIFDSMYESLELYEILYVIGKIAQLQSMAMISRDTTMVLPGELNVLVGSMFGQLQVDCMPCEIVYVVSRIAWLCSLAMLQRDSEDRA